MSFAELLPAQKRLPRLKSSEIVDEQSKLSVFFKYTVKKKLFSLRARLYVTYKCAVTVSTTISPGPTHNSPPALQPVKLHRSALNTPLA